MWPEPSMNNCCQPATRTLHALFGFSSHPAKTGLVLTNRGMRRVALGSAGPQQHLQARLSRALPLHLVLVSHQTCFVSWQWWVGLGWLFAFLYDSLMICVFVNPPFSRTDGSSALTGQGQVFRATEQPTFPIKILKMSWLQLLREFESFKARNIP